jgi:hypothetical protein
VAFRENAIDADVLRDLTDHGEARLKRLPLPLAQCASLICQRHR